MGCCIVSSCSVVSCYSQLAYRPAPASIDTISIRSASVWGSVEAYGDGTAQLQCLAHKELGALTHRHARSLAHHHHGRRAHGHSTGSLEHGGRWSGEWRVVVLLVVQVVPSQELLRRELVKVGGCMPGNRRVANWLCGVKAQSAHRHPHNFTDLTSTTSNCRHTTPLHSPKPPAIMSDNENGDEMVTKPFKFVTGTPPRPPAQLL